PFFAFVHYYDPHEYYVPNPLYDYGYARADRYWAEVSYTDHFVGELLSYLRERPDYDSLAVIIVSDHGDELWDHGYVSHGLRLYDESVGILFLLRDPRRFTRPAPRLLEGAVSGIDLAPTVLELLSIPVPPSMSDL